MGKPCIGIDIGSSAIKLVQLNVPRRGTPTLQNFGIEPLPPQVMVGGSIMNHGALVSALKNLTGRIRLRGKDAAIAVGGTGVIMKRLVIPFMEGAALDEQMEWEVQQNIPFARDDVSVDYSVLVPRTPEGQMEVLLAAVRREVVEQYLHVVRDAGLNPLVVDTTALALQNALEASIGFAPGEVVALVNVGATYSTLNVIANAQPMFTRDLPSGGNTFTEAIQQRLAVSNEGAEAYKVGGSQGAGADVVPQEVHRVLAQVSEQFAGELQRSLDFFMTDRGDIRLSRIYLTGGSSLVPQLPKAVQDRARVPVHILDPFVRTVVDGKRFDMDYLRATAPMATVAYGLALRQQGDQA